MRYPAFLRDGGRIGFIAPSFGCATEPYKSAFLSAQKKFREMGFTNVVGPNAYAAEGIGISNTPEKCAEEFTAYYCGSEADVLMSCGGGELMCEILPYVDWEKVKAAAPKWFMGYSDNTNLIFPLVTMCDTAAIYAQCVASFGMEPWHEALKDSFNTLCGRAGILHGYEKYEKESKRDETHPTVPYNVTEPAVRRAFPPGDHRMSGRLVGGCLDILTNLVGTPWDHIAAFQERYKDDGFLWVIEACDLTTIGVRRALWHLDNAGWFRYAKGFLIGRPYLAEDFLGLNRFDAVTEVLAKYDVPILMDVDTGHVPPQMPFVMGALATVELKGNAFTVETEYK